MFLYSLYFLQSLWVQYFASTTCLLRGLLILSKTSSMALQYTIPKQYPVLLELHITQRQLESPGGQNAAQSRQYEIKRCVTSVPHISNACLFFLKMTGLSSFWQMISRTVARVLTSEKDLFHRMNVWAKGPLLVRQLGDPLQWRIQTLS